MPKTRTDNLSFYPGIEDVFWKDDAPAPELPAETLTVLPSNDRPAQHLDEVLIQMSLEENLKEALRPDPRNRHILIPGKFNDTIEQTHLNLQLALQDVSSGEDVKIFSEAVDLLEEDKELVNLMISYRQTLHKA